MDILNTVLDQFRSVLVWSQPNVQLFGTLLLSAIAALGGFFVTTRAAIGGIKGGGFTTLLFELMFGMFKISVVYVLMTHVFEWGNDIIALGSIGAQAISGLSPDTLTPSGVFGWGIQIAKTFATSRSTGMTLLHPVDTLITYFVLLVVIVTWFSAGLSEFMVILEGLFIVTIAPIIICWAGMYIAFEMLIQWVWHVIAIALKLITIIVLLTVGALMANQWLTTLTAAGTTINLDPVGAEAILICESLLLFYCVWKLPDLAVFMVGIRGRSVALSLGEAFMGAMAGTAVNAATAGAGAAIEATPAAIRTAGKVSDKLFLE